MSDSKAAFARAIDSQFQRLGQEAIYIDQVGQQYIIRVIARLPEQLFDIGEQQLHAEKSEFMVRVSEVKLPQVGDQIHIGENIYQIETEPRIDVHQLLWTFDSVCLS